MRNLNYQAVITRVYRHFVIERHPPGIVGGRVFYHQTDDNGVDRPCAIGLFDADHLLATANLMDTDSQYPTLRDLYYHSPDLLADVFDVDTLTWSDVGFLSFIQEKHDYYALRSAVLCPDNANRRFAREMADVLENVAKHYDVAGLAF